MKCPPEGWKPLHEDNFEVMELIFKYNNLFYDGMGGLNAQGIDKVLEWEHYEGEEKNIMTQKLLMYLTTAVQTRQEEQQNAWKQK